MVGKLILTFFFAVLTALMIALNLQFFAFGIIFALFLGVVLSKRIEYGLYIMTAWIPLQYFLTKYYSLLPRHFVWVDEIVLSMMFLIIIPKKIIFREKINVCNVDVAVLLFLVVALISGIINAVNPLMGVLGVRDFLQYYILYLIVKNISLEKRALKVLSWIVIITLIVQLPVGLYQFYSWKPAYINNTTGGYVNGKGFSYYDAVVGTFVIGANNFGYLMALFILFSLGLFLGSRDKRWLFFAVYLFPVFCFARGMGAFFVFLISFVFYKVTLKNFLKFISISLISLVLFFAGSVYYGQYFNQKSDVHSIEEYIQQQLDVSPGSSGRLIGIKFTNDLLLENSPASLIGFGPGNYSSFTGRRFDAPHYVKAVNVLRNNRCLTENDIVPVIGEYGYSGYILFLLIAFWLFRRNEYISHNSQGLLSNLCFSAKGGFFIFLVGSVLTNIWSAAPIAFYVWLFAGCTQNMFLLQESRKDYIDAS